MKLAVRVMLDKMIQVLKDGKKRRKDKVIWTRYEEIKLKNTKSTYGVAVMFEDAEVYAKRLKFMVKPGSAIYDFPYLPSNRCIGVMPYFDSAVVKDNEYAIVFFIYNTKLLDEDNIEIIETAMNRILDLKTIDEELEEHHKEFVKYQRECKKLRSKGKASK